jgi:hypothetical protein
MKLRGTFESLKNIVDSAGVRGAWIESGLGFGKDGMKPLITKVDENCVDLLKGAPVLESQFGERWPTIVRAASGCLGSSK